jgi:hypothetical protein
MVQFDPEHLRIGAKLREQERQRWRKHAVDRALAFVFGLLICAALLAWPLAQWHRLLTSVKGTSEINLCWLTNRCDVKKKPPMVRQPMTPGLDRPDGSAHEKDLFNHDGPSYRVPVRGLSTS